MHPGWADTPGVAKSLPGLSERWGLLSLFMLCPVMVLGYQVHWWFLAHSIHHFRLSGNLRTNDEGADTVVWLALQPKEKLASGAFYFDRAEAPKHLKFAGTADSHAQINPIVDSIRSICGLSVNGWAAKAKVIYSSIVNSIRFICGFSVNGWASKAKVKWYITWYNGCMIHKTAKNWRVEKKYAPAGNRTRVCTVAGYYSTTRPLVPLMLKLCTYLISFESTIKHRSNILITHLFSVPDTLRLTSDHQSW
jgi:hypothetical protein